MGDTFNDWSVYYSGFVKKKNKLGVYIMRYAVLDDTTLVFYEDETESNEKVRYSMSTSWTIEPIAGFDFKLIDESNTGFEIILSTEKFEHLEAWLLSLTQSINGPYRESENFCSAERTNSHSSTDHQQFDRPFPSESVHADFLDPTFTLTSCLHKQNSSVLFLKYWKKIWCRVHNKVLFEYSYYEDFTEMKSIFINDQCRVVTLPQNFQGQPYSLSLLTTEMKKDSYKSLRLGMADESELLLWADYLNYCIDCYNRDRFALLRPPDNQFADESHSLMPLSISNRESTTVGVDMTSCNSPSNKTKKSNTKAFYLNDETARAKIQRFMTSSKQHNNENTELQTLYWDHFCTLVPDSPYVIVEVFEHQRFSLFPRRGFNVLNLFPIDPSKLSNHSGIKYPDRYLKRAEPPQGYRWVSAREVSGVVQSPHEVLSLIYTPEGWSTHPSYPAEDIDENGWTYGTSFEHLRSRCLQGQSRSNPNTTDVVRRRRWLRVATCFEEVSQGAGFVDSVFASLGTYLETSKSEKGEEGEKLEENDPLEGFLLK